MKTMRQQLPVEDISYNWLLTTVRVATKDLYLATNERD